MTDYLTTLAKRTLGLIPVAAPLITPSFAAPVKYMDSPDISPRDNMPSGENLSPANPKVKSGAYKPDLSRTFSQRSIAQNIAPGTPGMHLEMDAGISRSNINDQGSPETEIISDIRYQDNSLISYDNEQVSKVSTLISTP